QNPRDARRTHDGRHSARSVPRAGLPGGRSLSSHQQDAGRDLSGAGPLRNHVRTRAPARRDRRNALTTAELPYERPLEALGESIFMDTGDYIGLVDKQLTRIDWQKLNAEVKRRRAACEMIRIGVAMFIEKSGLGPADGVRISVDTSGAVEVVTGGASLGQGFETVMAQVAADGLGVDYKKCRVIHGQTDRIAFGIGAHASRATVMTASATHIAALNVRKKALEVAGELLQAAPDTLDIVGGEVVRKGQNSGP